MRSNLTTPEFLSAMQGYFMGEKTEALVFILPIGLLSLVFAAWLWTDSAGWGFMRGVALPFLAMGLLMTVVGATVGLRTPGQVSRLERSLQGSVEAAASAASAIQAETARMARVDAAWNTYLVIWGLMGAAGLALRFATSGGFSQGLGIALVFFSGVGLLVDGFAERRTHPYRSALAAMHQPTDAGAGSTDRRTP